MEMIRYILAIGLLCNALSLYCSQGPDQYNLIRGTVRSAVLKKLALDCVETFSIGDLSDELLNAYDTLIDDYTRKWKIPESGGRIAVSDQYLWGVKLVVEEKELRNRKQTSAKNSLVEQENKLNADRDAFLKNLTVDSFEKREFMPGLNPNDWQTKPEPHKAYLKLMTDFDELGRAKIKQNKVPLSKYFFFEPINKKINDIKTLKAEAEKQILALPKAEEIKPTPHELAKKENIQKKEAIEKEVQKFINRLNENDIEPTRTGDGTDASDWTLDRIMKIKRDELNDQYNAIADELRDFDWSDRMRDSINAKDLELRTLKAQQQKKQNELIKTPIVKSIFSSAVPQSGTKKETWEQEATQWRLKAIDFLNALTEDDFTLVVPSYSKSLASNWYLEKNKQNESKELREEGFKVEENSDYQVSDISIYLKAITTKIEELKESKAKGFVAIEHRLKEPTPSFSFEAPTTTTTITPEIKPTAKEVAIADIDRLVAASIKTFKGCFDKKFGKSDYLNPENWYLYGSCSFNIDYILSHVETKVDHQEVKKYYENKLQEKQNQLFQQEYGKYRKLEDLTLDDFEEIKGCSSQYSEKCWKIKSDVVNIARQASDPDKELYDYSDPIKETLIKLLFQRWLEDVLYKQIDTFTLSALDDDKGDFVFKGRSFKELYPNMFKLQYANKENQPENWELKGERKISLNDQIEKQAEKYGYNPRVLVPRGLFIDELCWDLKKKLNNKIEAKKEELVRRAYPKK